MVESSLERLAKSHPDLEIWWDSSPLVYDQWVRKMLNRTDPAHRPVLEEQLARLYNTETPSKSVFRGSTTNPSLSWQAIQADPRFWNEWVDELIHTNPGLDVKELMSEDGIDKRIDMVARSISKVDHQQEVLRVASLLAQVSGGVSTDERDVLVKLQKAFALDESALERALSEAEGAFTQ